MGFPSRRDDGSAGRRPMNAEPKVFISYRREEAAAYAGRLYDAMAERFGKSNVFMDVDLKPGVDFVDQITRGVGACEALIAVMGPSWATVTDEEGGVRIADPEDFVRLEVETALKRPDVTLIPVLVSGARMPDPDELPEEIQPITRRHALELRNDIWRYDVGRLNDTLDELFGGVAAAPADTVPPKRPLPRPPTWRFILEGVVVAGLAALVARALAPDIRLDIGTAGEPSRFITNLIQVRGVTWAVAGVALGIWLAFRVRAAHDYGRCALLGLLVGAIAGALGGAIFGFPVAYGEDQDRFSTTAQLINVGSFAVTGALIGALIGGLWLPPRVAAGLASGGVAAALAVAPFVGGDTKEWVFFLNAAAIAGATLATLLAINAKRPTTGRRADARATEP
jgi:TIR domain